MTVQSMNRRYTFLSTLCHVDDDTYVEKGLLIPIHRHLHHTFDNCIQRTLGACLIITEQSLKTSAKFSFGNAKTGPL